MRITLFHVWLKASIYLGHSPTGKEYGAVLGKKLSVFKNHTQLIFRCLFSHILLKRESSGHF